MRRGENASIIIEKIVLMDWRLSERFCVFFFDREFLFFWTVNWMTITLLRLFLWWLGVQRIPLITFYLRHACTMTQLLQMGKCQFVSINQFLLSCSVCSFMKTWRTVVIHMFEESSWWVLANLNPFVHKQTWLLLPWLHKLLLTVEIPKSKLSSLIWRCDNDWLFSSLFKSLFSHSPGAQLIDVNSMMEKGAIGKIQWWKKGFQLKQSVWVPYTP